MDWREAAHGKRDKRDKRDAAKAVAHLKFPSAQHRVNPIRQMSNKPFEFQPSGLIEFEHVASEPVDAPLDTPVDESIDTDLLSINFGRSKECKPTSAERMLAGVAIDWLVAFPVESRPKALCERFPHVANRLAKDWSDTARSAQSLHALVADMRWGSAGFPVQVQSELRRLLQIAGSQRST